MKLFAFIGFVVSVLSVAGMLGIGHFRLIYSPTPINCVASGEKT